MVAEQPWFGKAALAFQERTLNRVKNFSPEEFSKEALRLDREQRTFLEQECINLYPGTNILTPTVSSLLGSTVASRAAEGHPGAKYQTGLGWVDEAEVIATELVRRVFDARYAEVRGLSGSMANTAVLNSLTGSNSDDLIREARSTAVGNPGDREGPVKESRPGE